MEDTITFNELQQMIGTLFIENVLLKKKISYLENAIEQLTGAKKETAIQEKEGKLGLPGD